MDFTHLQAIGLISSCELPREDLEFLSTGPERSYFQFIFGCPLRPSSVFTLDAYLEYLEKCEQSWPEVAASKGGPEFPVIALRMALAWGGGSTDRVMDFLRSSRKKLTFRIVQSRLCDTLMRQEGVWDISLLQDVFTPGLVPPSIVSSSTYIKYSWPKKYNARTFLSIDMREANFTSLILMAKVIDPELYSFIGEGWQAFLGKVLGADEAAIIVGVRQFRQLLLGTLEREWVSLQRKHGCLRRLIGEPSLERINSFAVCDFVTKGIGDNHDLTHEERQACHRAQNRFRRRISSSGVAVQKVVLRWAVGVVSNVLGLELFAFAGSDEAVFLLPEGQRSAACVDETLHKCSCALKDALQDEHKDFANRLRLEAFYPIDVSSALGVQGFPQATIVLTRRLQAKSFVQIKTVSRDANEETLTILSQAIADAKRLNSKIWFDWMD